MTNFEISENIRLLALNILSRTVVDVVFSEQLKDRCHDMTIYQVGIAAELFLKAKLISVNPALVFLDLSDKEYIKIDNLSLLDCKTIKYSELLKYLFETVAIKGNYSREFEYFGKLRNISLHFGYNNFIKNPSFEVLKFIFESLVPLLYEIKYFEENEFIHAVFLWDEVVISEGCLIDYLDKLNIEIPKALKRELSKSKDE